MTESIYRNSTISSTGRKKTMISVDCTQIESAIPLGNHLNCWGKMTARCLFVMCTVCVLVYVCACTYDWLVLSKDNIKATGPEASLRNKGLIDAGWTNLSEIIRVFYSYQYWFILGYNNSLGNRDIFWSSLQSHMIKLTTLIFPVSLFGVLALESES